MNLESALLLLLIAVIAIAVYRVQRSLLEILKTLWLVNVKALNAALFLKPDEANLEQQCGEPQSESLRKVN